MEKRGIFKTTIEYNTDSRYANEIGFYRFYKERENLYRYNSKKNYSKKNIHLQSIVDQSTHAQRRRDGSGTAARVSKLGEERAVDLRCKGGGTAYSLLLLLNNRICSSPQRFIFHACLNYN